MSRERLIRLLDHYRMMAKWSWRDGDPTSARFFNDCSRRSIAEYRESAQPELDLAA